MSTAASSSDALTTTICNSIQALGRGFDVTSDIRLLYCKGVPGSRLVLVDEERRRDLVLCDGVVVPSVSVEIDCSTGQKTIERIDVCSFHEVKFVFFFFLPYHLSWACLNFCFWLVY
uniref:Uncharacterized protein n=1 Tax=Rhizophora mucronata TaxID=61149 RepID=A0A2P2K303_RHIMU